MKIKNLRVLRLLKWLFGIYAVIIFIITLLITSTAYFIVFTFFNKKKSPFIAHQYISRNWARILFLCFAIRLKIKNKNLLDKETTYVFIANHRSQLDVPAYAIATDHTIRFLAKAELSKIPLMGFIIRNLYISVNRKNKSARAKSMENMLNTIRENISVFICPEGTRNKTDQPLLPFHDGAFRLAIEAQVPLAMLVLKNSDVLLSPEHPTELSPGVIEGVWLRPIPTAGMKQDDLVILKEIAIKQMTEELQK